VDCLPLRERGHRWAAFKYTPSGKRRIPFFARLRKDAVSGGVDGLSSMYDLCLYSTRFVNNLQLRNKNIFFKLATVFVNNLQMKDQGDIQFDFEFLDKLIVGIGEVAQITGIPARQIRYWEEKGLITSLTEEEGKNRRYDYKNIKKMLLIKELVDEGYTLDAAAQKIAKRLETIEAALQKLKKNAVKPPESDAPAV
jgi:predicted transcriptional regulator